MEEESLFVAILIKIILFYLYTAKFPEYPEYEIIPGKKKDEK